MPSIQSPMARDSPAKYRLLKSLPGFSCPKPSRMLSSVSDEIHSRLTGTLHSAFWYTHR